jgi:deferrochelatase/peroxidase EfeB
MMSVFASSRRGFVAGSAGLLGAAVAGGARAAHAAPAIEPFHGLHQAGIATPPQGFTSFAVFDVTAGTRAALQGLLRRWTAAAARMASGEAPDAADRDDAPGLPPARLTLTFGFGAGLFEKDGRDRFGLRARRPAPLIDLPPFTGDALEPARTGGDLSVQACAEDPQTAFHAVRRLARIAAGDARIRWAQAGFLSPRGAGTPRNLLGFKDGTQNVNVADPFALDTFVWSGLEGPAAMRGGTYLVVRRIRLAVERWDGMDVAEQERIIGRRKVSGAPAGGEREFEVERFDRRDGEGRLAIAADAHVRLASYEGSGARILRRGYSYEDGGVGGYEAGLLFMAYQKDPRSGFVKMFGRMAGSDRLMRFSTHVGSGIFAVPPGVAVGGWVGDALVG